MREVRGWDLMWGIELADPRRRPAGGRAGQGGAGPCLRRGLILELGGRDDGVVRLLPPLNVTAEVIDIACAILVDVINGLPTGRVRS